MASDGGRRPADLTAAATGPAAALKAAPGRYTLLAAVQALEAAGHARVRYRAALAPVFAPGDVEAVTLPGVEGPTPPRQEAVTQPGPETATRPGLGAAARPDAEAARPPRVAEASPPRIEALTPPRTDALTLPHRGDPVVETAVLSLFGPEGPLPAPLAEAVRRRARAGDAGARDFFDLFGDRLVRAFVDMLRLEHPSAAAQAPERTPMAVALRALAGRADPAEGPAGFDRALLAGAGLLHARAGGLDGVARLIAAALAAPVRARGFVGGWTPLAAEDRARLRPAARPGARLDRGAGARLGGGAALGTRVWLQDARVVLDIGPTDAGALRALLPGGPGHARLAALAAHALPPQVDIDARVTLAPHAVPTAGLGAARDSRLGWTSWLAPRTAPARPAAATFRLRGGAEA